MFDTTTCQLALKEWAAVCRALSTGEQAILLRKGGLREPDDTFHVKRDTFWLLETNFHQQPDELTERGQVLLGQALVAAPPPGQLAIRCCGRVIDTWWVEDPRRIERLAGEHILADTTVRKRFDYRHPGLHVMLVRAATLPEPVTIEETAEIAGCRSWVDLSEPLSLTSATPVLDDAAFAERQAAIRNVLEPA